MNDEDIAAKPPKRLKRLIRWIAALAILSLFALASMPTVLSTAPARRALVRAINQKLNPGRIELGGLSLSWTRGVVLSDVVLIDPKGKTVAKAESVRSNQGILGLLASRSQYGTIHVNGATVDFERRADGSIDVLEALGGLMGQSEAGPPGSQAGDPGPSSSLAVAVIVDGGPARIVSPEFAEPITSSSFKTELRVVPGKPVDVVATLIEEDRSLELRVGYDVNAAPGASADWALTLTGKDWPLAARRAGFTAKGRLEGVLQADCKQGLWSLQGDAVLREAVADAAVLAGDRLALDRVAADFSVIETASGWSIRKLDMRSPIAELSATGDVPATTGTPSRLSGHIDLAAASKLLPHAVPLRRGIVIDKGEARVAADLNIVDGAERIVVSADLADLAATENGRALALQKPASLSAALVRTKGNTTVESFTVKGAGVDATATGDLEHGLKLSGEIDLAAIEAQARELIDLGTVKLAGKGRMAADYRPDGGTFKARFAAELDGLRVEGLTAEPIARDHVRLEGSSDGPRGADGLPTDWRAARLGVEAGDTKARLYAKATDGSSTFVLDGSIPTPTAAPGIASGKITARRVDEVFVLDEVQLKATPVDPGAVSATVAIHAKGKLDLAAGRLVLTPVGPQASPGVAVAPEGFTLDGIGKSDAPTSLDAALVGELWTLDQAIAYWTQTPSHGLAGAWSGRVGLARQLDGRLDFNGGLNSPDLVVTTPRGAVTLAGAGSYSPAADQLSLTSFDLTTAYARLRGAGTLADVGGGRLADVSATLEPRWESLDPLVASSVGGDAHVRATVKPFHLRGSLAAGSTSQILKGMEGALEVDLASAQAFGMLVGPTPIVLRMGGGKAVFDPIATTLNDGKLEIGGDLFLDDPAALWLRLAKGTRIEGAAINQAVSNDVLSYIAPILAKASNLSGTVSLRIDGAAIPVVGDGALRVDGQLVFQNVVFQPGPFATEIVAMTGNVAPKMTLHEPLQLQIADGRVRQSGLTIPLPENLTAKIDGSVGFDKTLALRAVVPVTAKMLGGNAVASEFVAGTDVAIPIGGTISQPKIDRAGLRLALRDAVKSMVKRGARAEAGRLLDQVLPPAAGGRNATPGSPGGLSGGDALKALEGLGREFIQPRRR